MASTNAPASNRTRTALARLHRHLEAKLLRLVLRSASSVTTSTSGGDGGVGRLFERLLGRTATPEEIRRHRETLETGGSPFRLVRDIRSSAEGRRHKPPFRGFDAIVALAVGADLLVKRRSELLVGLPIRLWDKRLRVVATSSGVRLLRRSLFDGADYVDRNPDLRGIVSDPYLHFHRYGWREGRPARMSSPKTSQASHAAEGVSGDRGFVTIDQTRRRNLIGMMVRRHLLGRFFGMQPTGRPYVYRPPVRPPDASREVLPTSADPLFSIVVPTYNARLVWLKELVQSVEAQWTADWELVFVDDASPDPKPRTWLRKLAARRPGQVKVHERDTNGGISATTNDALHLATGRYVVFLDHDDLLTPDCLHELGRCIARHDPDFIYSDEDKLLPDGSFADPHFKPDWSPDTLLSTMYTCHVMCVRRTLLEQVGGLRSEFDGCQDWDLVLRLTEHTKRIQHIPRVLYHWRVSPSSTAGGNEAKPYVIERQVRVREEALRRRQEPGRLEPVPGYPDYHRVVRTLTGAPKFSIVIPTRDNGEVLARCIDSIGQLSTHANREVVIIDNGSVKEATLETLQRLSRRPGVRVVRRDEPFNFSRLCNAGAAATDGGILVFLNDDTEVLTGDWLERLGGYAVARHVGAVGAKLLYPGGRLVQHCGVVNLGCGPSHAHVGTDDSLPGYFLRSHVEYDWSAVTAACLAIERTKFDAVGRFDESFPVAYNDVELCFRLVERGLFNVVTPGARLIHHESLTRGHDSADPAKMERLGAERRRLYETHPRFFHYDPWFNANLNPNSPFFEL